MIGFRPPDAKWRKMKDVYDACVLAGVEVPDEVAEFFENGEPDPRGVEVELEAQEWQDDMRQGFEIAIKDLPKDVTHIRFYNSW